MSPTPQPGLGLRADSGYGVRFCGGIIPDLRAQSAYLNEQPLCRLRLVQ